MRFLGARGSAGTRRGLGMGCVRRREGDLRRALRGHGTRAFQRFQELRMAEWIAIGVCKS
jgi:hypothetical protein